jgi:hypothetical protein
VDFLKEEGRFPKAVGIVKDAGAVVKEQVNWIKEG